MKSKKRGILLILAFVVTSVMCSCGSNNYKTTTEMKKEGGTELITYGAFVPISGEEENGLFYHKKSKTVYVLFDRGMGWDYAVFSATPYIDEGHYWEYVDGKIVPDKIVDLTSETNTEETSDEMWASLTEEEKAALLEEKGY